MRGPMTRLLLTLALAISWRPDRPALRRPPSALRQSTSPSTPRTAPPPTQAGSHPYEQSTINLRDRRRRPQNRRRTARRRTPRTSRSHLPPGLVGDPNAVPRCSAADFLTSTDLGGNPSCPDTTAVGFAEVEFGEVGNVDGFPVYNLVPPPGPRPSSASSSAGAPVTIDLVSTPSPPIT